MHDVVLFARLFAGAPAMAEELVPLLDALAAEPLHRRVPIFAAIGPALAHADGRVRAAALRALCGADGRDALTRIVDALDDDDAEVRRAGVECLRAIWPRDPMRWAHAVFHGREDVRRMCVESDVASPLHVYLLGDVSCREQLDAMLATLEVPENAYPVVLAFFRRGRLGADSAARLLARIGARPLLTSAARGDGRAESIQSALLGGGSDASGSDGFDGLFEVLAAATAPEATALVAALVGAVMDLPPASQRRACAAARAVMIRQERRQVELCLVIACSHPDVLLHDSVPVDIRRGTAAQLGSVARELPAIDPLSAEQMIGQLVEHDGCLDLRAAAGLLRMARRYVPLLEAFGLDRIVEAAVADPRGGSAILLLADGSKRGRTFLLDAIAKRSPEGHGTVLAWLAATAPADKLDFLDELDGSRALELAKTLATLEGSQEELALRPNKVRNLVAMMGFRFAQVPSSLRGSLRSFTEHFLGLGSLEERRFGKAMLEELGRAAGAEAFALELSELPAEALCRLIELLPMLTRLPYACELALACALAAHDDAGVLEWARGRIPETAPPRPAVPEGVYRLGDIEVRRIVECPDAALAGEIRMIGGAASLRLAEALAARTSALPCVETCVALLGCHDAIDLVADQFERFRSREPAWMQALDASVVRAWEASRELPLLGAAWLWRWERHAFAVTEKLFGSSEGPACWLKRALDLRSPLLCEQIWHAVGASFLCWGARDVGRVHELVAGESASAVVEIVVGQLDTDVDDAAAKIFVALHRAGVGAAIEATDRVKAILPDVSDAARRRLEQVVRAWGLLGAGRTARRQAVVEVLNLGAIRASTDLDALEAWCRSASDRVVQEAALRMTELGGEALERVARIILAAPPVTCSTTLIESIALWPDCPALSLLRGADGDAELLFRITMAFIERGEALAERAMALACAPAKESWFRPGDYERLLAVAGPLSTAIGLASSPQPHAYMRAVDVLVQGEDSPPVLQALRAFLEAGTQRLEDLRIRAATYLQQRGDALGFPVLLAHAFDSAGSYGRLFAGLSDRYVTAVIDAVLLAGPAALSEARALLLVEPVHVSPEARLAAYERLLVDATLEHTAERIMNILSAQRIDSAARQSALERVAQIFAWGTREGLVLTRRRHTVHMSSRESLGFTRFDGDRIWVSALPALRGDRHGEAIVEALILHEIGHHRYHRGPRAAEVWAEAQREGIHGLLNLVADEHLERNLRALDQSYGDRLKRLAAHAFRHSRRDIEVDALLSLLGPEAFEVLSGCTLGVAHGTGKVRVESGRLLSAMEQRGLAFTRFVRALRMGLGDRWQDDRVREALSLFDKQFRHHDMAELLEVARKLRDLFGWEVSLCERFGGHETHSEESREHTRWGRGITDEEVQREVERVLNPSKRRLGGEGGDPSKLWINVSEEERFELIHNIEHVPPDRAKHRAIAHEVGRHARILRAFLERLGIAHERTPHRAQGRRLDRAQLSAMVIRGEPRVLVSRSLAFMSDLFLGVVVDCSGSMEGSDHIAKARRFACLVAEAAHGLPGVDARFFGFTDAVIYDAGDARRCAAASLETSGGNNDAAALFHVARVARKSRRRAKVLVMISDGLPTECSAAALKGLVGRLSRGGMMLAQVAVCPLEEQCFPHYVVLEGEMDGSVRKFGQVVARLVSRAMG